jgi:transposase InsO family protein
MARRDEHVRAAMQELSGLYPRFGYRRIQVFLGRRGLPVSADRAYRIWSAAGLQGPKKRPRRGLACSRPRPVSATAENRIWAYHFVFRCPCQRAATEVSDGDRRVDPRMSGVRCGRQHSIFSSDRSALEAQQRSWCTQGPLV